MNRRLGHALALALGLLAVLPAVVSAHPLGNFTINHYAGIRVARDSVLVDFVLDRAEIPTFQEVRRIDANGDGTIDPAEAAALRAPECLGLAPLLDLRLDGTRLDLGLVAAGITFPPGAGGLATMRLVCTLRAALSIPLATTANLTFEDRSYPERIGWREITVVGDGTSIGPAASGVTAAGGASADGASVTQGGSVPPTSTASARLTAYPTDLLATPLDMRSVAFTAAPGGAELAAFAVPDATPLSDDAASGAVAAPGQADTATSPTRDTGAPGEGTVAGREPGGATAPVTAAVPGGVGTEISGLLEARDLTPLALLLSILTAALLGAGHALTPGHGKTVMAAYLVGARGTARHAVGLGLSVTVSHTLGILILAGIVAAAGGALPPETFTRWAPLASALLVLGIGGWLVAGQVRAHRARRTGDAAAHAHEHERDQGHSHPHPHEHAADHAHEREHLTASGHAHPHEPDHNHPPDGREDPGDHDHAVPGEHAHGGIRHRHLPAGDAPITWRSLALLGLAGGIVPSTNALLLLLAAIASGRPAWGLVLVVAFGLGMAVVLGGVGLALVHARGLAARSERGRFGRHLGRLAAVAPAVGAATVLALGVWLTSQAIAGSFVL